MQLLLKEVPDRNLQVFVFWAPIHRGDYRSVAEERASESYDPRMAQIWDVNGLTAYLWESVLGVNTLVWDVYMLYGKDAQWTGEPTPPVFWMHQREDMPGNFFNQAQFEAKVRELLKRAAAAK
jgi:hypothetical protein